MHATSPQGRFTEGAAAVDGATLGAAEAHGKHLFLHLSTGGSVHVHLGMQGKWFRSTDPAAPPLRQVRLRLATDGVAWDLVAPCECEVLDPAAVTEVVSRLGPDPLRPDDSAERAVRALHRAGGAIGAALLDQAVVSGVGNVFRSEALHAVGVAPMRPARAMREPELGSVWGVLQRMMSQAVEDGRIVTVDGPGRLSLPESESRKVHSRTAAATAGHRSSPAGWAVARRTTAPSSSAPRSRTRRGPDQQKHMLRA